MDNWYSIVYGALIIAGFLFFLPYTLRWLSSYGWIFGRIANVNYEDSRSIPPHYTTLLIGIMVLSSILRAVKLDTSFSCEELAMLREFITPFGFWRLDTIGLGDHRLCSVISYLILKVCGPNEIAIRLPVFLLGITTIPLIFLFGREFFSSKEGLLTAFLLAVSSTHILYSNQARGYVPLVFFHLASSFVFLKLLLFSSPKPPKKYYYLLGAMTTAGMYSHFLFLVVVIMQLFVLIGALALRKLFKKSLMPLADTSAWYVALALLSGVCASLFLYGPLIFKATHNHLLHFANRGVPISFWNTLSIITTGSPALEFVVIYLVLFAIGLAHLSVTGKAIISFYSFAIVVLPLIIADISHFLPANDRYFIFILPLSLLVTVHGSFIAASFLRKKVRSLFLAMLTLLFFSFQVPSLLDFLNSAANHDYRGCARFIEKAAPPKDKVFTIGSCSKFLQSYEHRHTIIPDPSQKVFFDALDEDSATVWLIVITMDMPNWPPPATEIYEYARENLIETDHFPGLGTDIVIYKTHASSRSQKGK